LASLQQKQLFVKLLKKLEFDVPQKHYQEFTTHDFGIRAEINMFTNLHFYASQ